jgi:integrase/recombinase XerD
MTPLFDSQAETRLLAAYRATLPIHRMAAVVSQIRHTCGQFRALYPKDSPLNHGHTTEWVRAWRDAQSSNGSTKYLTLKLQAVRQWFSWLFVRGHIDNHVLAYISPTKFIAGTEPELILRHNLQRPIATFLAERAPRLEATRAHYRCYLGAFNVFINRRIAVQRPDNPLDEDAVMAWLRYLAGHSALTTTMRAVSIVNGFLNFLMASGSLAQNPIAGLTARYPRQSRQRVLRALVDRPSEELPPRADAATGFISSMGPQFEGYLALQRGLGRRFTRVETILLHLDRFLATGSETTTVISHQVLARWLASTPHLAPSTVRAHASAARQFCRFLARTDARTWIPDASLCLPRVPQLQPHVFSVGEVRALLAAALRLPAGRWSLQPQTFHCLLLVLYATGLRIGEALRLRIRDVDLDARTFFIVETKFFKSRWAPFREDLASRLRSYLTARTESVSAVHSYDPFFINSWRRPLSYSRVAHVFRGLLKEAGVQVLSKQHSAPRLHDLRRAFACHRLINWYRAGEDVQAKLPLLATYLGHGDISATHVYLTATAELLEEAGQRFERAYGSLVTA